MTGTLPAELVWKVPSKFIDSNGITISLEYRRMLVCRNLECGIFDPASIKLFTTDLETSKWWGNPPLDNDPVGVVTFSYGKGMVTEPSDLWDVAVCGKCGYEWEVSSTTDAYDLE